MKYKYAAGSNDANKTILEAVELVSGLENTALVKGVAAIIGLLVFFISQRIMMLVADFRRRRKERLRRLKRESEDAAATIASAAAAAKGGAKGEEAIAFVQLSAPPPTGDVVTASPAAADASAASGAPDGSTAAPLADNSSPAHKISAIACAEEAGSGSFSFFSEIIDPFISCFLLRHSHRHSHSRIEYTIWCT